MRANKAAALAGVETNLREWLDALTKRSGTTGNQQAIAAQVARGLILVYGDPDDDVEELTQQIVSGDFNYSIERIYSKRGLTDEIRNTEAVGSPHVECNPNRDRIDARRLA